MANFGKKKRIEKLREGYRRGQELLKASRGKTFKGFVEIIRKVYDPSWLKAADWEKVATMGEDEFVAYALSLKPTVDEREQVRYAPQPTNQPTNIQQLEVDFDTDWKLAVVGICKALERIADIMEGNEKLPHYNPDIP